MASYNVRTLTDEHQPLHRSFFFFLMQRQHVLRKGWEPKLTWLADPKPGQQNYALMLQQWSTNIKCTSCYVEPAQLWEESSTPWKKNSDNVRTTKQNQAIHSVESDERLQLNLVLDGLSRAPSNPAGRSNPDQTRTAPDEPFRCRRRHWHTDTPAASSESGRRSAAAAAESTAVGLNTAWESNMITSLALVKEEVSLPSLLGLGMLVNVSNILVSHEGYDWPWNRKFRWKTRRRVFQLTDTA